MCRTIKDLAWADWNTNGGTDAPFVTKKKSTAAQKRGLAYERKLGDKLGAEVDKLALPPDSLLAHPWIEFEDANGPGRAQPDFLIWKNETTLIVIEAKLTQCETAWIQLWGKYVPLLAYIYKGIADLTLIPIMACRNLERHTNTPYCTNAPPSDIIETWRDARPGAIWHFL